jgi:hypothetical protein
LGHGKPVQFRKKFFYFLQVDIAWIDCFFPLRLLGFLSSQKEWHQKGILPIALCQLDSLERHHITADAMYKNMLRVGFLFKQGQCPRVRMQWCKWRILRWWEMMMV